MSTINIKYGINYHIKRLEDGYQIEFNDKNRTYVQSVVGNTVGEAKQIASVDEMVTLSDKKQFIRLRNEVYIK